MYRVIYHPSESFESSITYTARTLKPRSRRSLITQAPRKPEPPVTSTFEDDETTGIGKMEQVSADPGGTDTDKSASGDNGLVMSPRMKLMQP